jgi:hypothetical protein
MLSAMRVARERCNAVRQTRRDRAARKITRFCKSIGLKSFSAKLHEGVRSDAARVIQCCARKFIATHRVRVLHRQRHRRRLERHAVTVISRSARRKLDDSLLPRKALAEECVESVFAYVLFEEMTIDAVDKAQAAGAEEAGLTAVS